MPFIGKQSTSNSQITNYTTTVGSGGQTNFTVIIEGGDETHVYLNGVLLKETTDYTVSSTQVSLVSPAVENDIVEIKVFRSFALVDAVKATGGTMTGELEVPTVKLSSNVIKASDGGSTITLDTSDNVTLAGNLKVKDGGTIGSASDADAITISSSGAVTLSSDFVPATPLSHRNMIINGAMEVSQRGTSFTTGSGYGDYTLDRFASAHTQTGKFTIDQVEDGPTGFKNSLKVTSSSAYSVGASEDFLIRHKIEGKNCIPFEQGTSNAKTVTLSFYVKSSLTGTFAVSFQNSAGNRHYIATYTISSANTWERKTISLTLDTSGTWLTTTGIGLTIAFSLGVGSNLDGTAGSWADGNKLSTSSSVDLISTNGATWFLTGVQLELGSVATPFEHKSYAEELRRCERYYHVISETNTNGKYIGMGWSYSANYFTWTYDIPLVMRSAPVVKNSTGSAFYYNYHTGSGINYTTVPAGTRTNRCVTFDFNSNGNYTAGNAGGMYIAHADAYIHLDSEL